jgi:hypothetical protein
MGLDVRTLYDKEFLYSFDLQGRDVTVVIERVKAGVLTGVGGKKNKKPVVYFRGKEKGLGLNITNARTIAAMYGGFDVEKWIGKAVTLYATTTTFGDKTVDCIRIRPEIPRAANGRGQQSAPPPVEESDEDAENRRNAEPTPEEMP